MNKQEVIAVIIIGITLFLLVRYTATKPWHVVVVLICGFFAAVYIPGLPSFLASVAGWLSSHVTALTHH